MKKLLLIIPVISLAVLCLAPVGDSPSKIVVQPFGGGTASGGSGTFTGTFSGDGSGLTNLPASSATNYIANTNGVGYGVTVLQKVTGTNFTGDGSGLTNLIVSTNFIANTNGTGVGTITLDKVVSTNFTGNAANLTNFNTAQVSNAAANSFVKVNSGNATNLQVYGSSASSPSFSVSANGEVAVGPGSTPVLTVGMTAKAPIGGYSAVFSSSGGNLYYTVRDSTTGLLKIIGEQAKEFTGISLWDTTGATEFARWSGSSFMGSTNALANWPTAALTPGGFALVDSNATVYLLTSSPNSTTWAATNSFGGAAANTWTMQVLQGNDKNIVISTNDQFAALIGVTTGSASPTYGSFSALPSTGYLSNLTVLAFTNWPAGTNLTACIQTNKIATTNVALPVDSLLKIVMQTSSVGYYTNDSTHSIPLTTNMYANMRLTGNTNIPQAAYTWTVEWWHQ